jgi:alanyl-tRNA synthetase
MTSKQIRQQFLDFFASKEHAIVDSSPVVPLDDPTLMFTNAGMNQFKDVFLGTGSRPYSRAADTQKCIRAGGKHNDLDDVGQDTYHHTFFEMLGNWSFGDYFKKEAIEWAWELLTEVWGIEKDRLHATYFEGDEAEGLEPDNEAAQFWRTVTDIGPSHVHPGNKKDNFWEMGDTGPCGPCSEIHIDLTPDKSGSTLVNAGDPRVIELWNLVFIQFNRDAAGKLTPLPAKHVDTGMGFERLCAVLQGKHSNYDSDVWTPVFEAIQRRTGAPAYARTLPDAGGEDRTGAGSDAGQIMIDVSYRVIADHVRCLAFALTDGGLPSNEGRGYVLRRILRRAVRYGRQYMDMHEPFLCDLVAPVVSHMGDAFPELRTGPNPQAPRDNVQHVAQIIRDEEASFLKTLDRGIRLFGEAAEYARKRHHGKVTGEDAFKLHDTYGFPIDLTEQMAEEQGLTIDIGEYERLMEAARERAKAVTVVEADPIVEQIQAIAPTVTVSAPPTNDTPKYRGSTLEATVVGWFDEEREAPASATLRASQAAGLLLDATPFYAEQGGQVGDVGTIETDTGTFDVRTTVRTDKHVVHVGLLRSGSVERGQTARCRVDPAREKTKKNHTATHMLNWALREVLGDHIDQKGSAVDPEKARFDFSHNRPLTTDEVTRVEALVNELIQKDLPVHTKEVPLDAARKVKTLRAVFGEKYADPVRVVSVGAEIGEPGADDPETLLGSPDDPKWMKYPVEFCGGTHLARTGEAERFVLILEESVAKGVRRLVGITGEAALQAEAAGQGLLAELEALAAKPPVAPGSEVPIPEDLGAGLAVFQKRVEAAVIPLRIRRALQERVAALQKEVKKQQKQAAATSGDAVMDQVAKLLTSAEEVAGVKVVVGEVPGAPVEALRGAIDWIRNKTDASAVLLAMVDGEKVTLIAGMSKDVVKRGVKAGDLIKEIVPLVGGRGGGRPDMAQGGGNDPAKLSDAIQNAAAWLRARLG